jgi:hypothetical protein
MYEVEPSTTRGVPPPTPADSFPIAEIAPEESRKACPFWGESALAIAKKYKHCDEIIDVTLRIAAEARRAAERRDPPQVFMNAGGGGGRAASSASLAAAAAPSSRNPERVQIRLQTSFPLLVIRLIVRSLLLIAGVVFLFDAHFCVGLTLLLFGLAMYVGPMHQKVTFRGEFHQQAADKC